MYKLIDSHAHLEEVKDLAAALERARDCGLVAVVAVGSDYESNQRVLEIAARYQGFVYAALGLHPWNLARGSSVDRALRFIEDNMGRAVAVGEVGLDYHKKVVQGCSKERQRDVLRSLLGLARQYDKAVAFHSRYAWRDSFNLVREAGVERAVFHWYTGPLNVLREMVEQGYCISATIAAEYHEEHRRAVRAVPLANLLLETDAPVVYREGTESEPADVVRSLRAAAALREVSPEVVAAQTTENAQRLYSISPP